MIIFDGYSLASKLEDQLRERVAAWKVQTGGRIRVAAILFEEDAGSQLYTRLKKEAAERVGIEYKVFSFSFLTPLEEILSTIATLNADPKVTGIIIQKPWRKTWLSVLNDAGAGQTPEAYAHWWLQLVSALEPTKDIDGLHPDTHLAIQKGTWEVEGKVLPATARAVLSILRTTGMNGELPSGRYVVIGKSDLLGVPLEAVLRHLRKDVTLMGKKDLEAAVATPEQLHDFDVVVSATGQADLIKGKWLKPGVVLIDVGEPKPDVDRASVGDIPGFLTPVPGGVGPMTVVSLLENALNLVE